MTIDAQVTLGNERDTDLSVDALLALMDRAGVERAVVHPPDRALAVDHRAGNDAMLDAARRHPDRLIAACTANPWLGAAAGRLVRDALARGARVIALAPALQGFILGDELLFPLLDAVAETRAVIYVHTGPHLHAAPWQLVGVAERYPSLPFIMGHCGATDFWNDAPHAAQQAPNIHLESSFARPFIFRNHLATAGFERGMMGSGAPRNDLVFEWAQMRHAIPEREHPELYGPTLQRLLDGVRP